MPRLLIIDDDRDLTGMLVEYLEFDVLRALLESAGQVVSREALFEKALQREYTVFDRSIDNHVIYASATRVLRANKDYVRMLTDLHGDPELRADHTAPTTPSALAGDGSADGEPRERATDALDFYATWKIFDGLVDAVFHGTHREYALGNRP